MTLANAPAIIQGCAARFGRLSADGSVAAGATNSIVTDKAVEVKTAWVVDAGDEFTVKTACGTLAFPPFRGQDYRKWRSVELTMAVVDAEQIEMIEGALLITRSATVTAAITSGSAAIVGTSAALFSQQDVGKAITGTGIPGATTILTVTDATHATLSATATATNAAATLTIAARDTIGWADPALGLAPTNALSLEVWAKRLVGGAQAATDPWLRSMFARTYNWVPGERRWFNGVWSPTWTGMATENTGIGTGPGRDWTGPTSRVLASMADSGIPVASPGYTTVGA